MFEKIILQDYDKDIMPSFKENDLVESDASDIEDEKDSLHVLSDDEESENLFDEEMMNDLDSDFKDDQDILSESVDDKTRKQTGFDQFQSSSTLIFALANSKY